MSFAVCVHFFPSQLLALYRGLVPPCMKYGSHVWLGSTHTTRLNRVESIAFRLINSPPLTNCLDSLSHRRNVASSSATLILIALLNLLNTCLPSYRSLAAQDFLLLHIFILTIYLMKELNSIFTLSSITLANSETLFLCLFFHLPMT